MIQQFLPREFYDIVDEEDDETAIEEGYLFIQHVEDEEPFGIQIGIFLIYLKTWFTPSRKDGTRKIKERKGS
jgi:hypothetical protein